MSYVKNIQGYDIKDETARNDISVISNTITFDEHNHFSNADELRNNYSNNFHSIDFPVNMGTYFNKLNIFESYDKKKYIYYLDESLLKNNGGSTKYVDVHNTIEVNNGSAENPWNTITKAFQNANSGDTIIVKKGIYNLHTLPSTSGTRLPNLNIICEDGVIITASTSLEWTQNETYSNVYQATRSELVNLTARLRELHNLIFHH